MYDANTHYLNDYEHQHAALEHEWENSLEDKQEAVISWAVDLLKSDCTAESFQWVFTEYLDNEDVVAEAFLAKLQLLNSSDSYLGITDIAQIALTALHGACQSRFDVEFDVLFEDKSEGKVIVEVLDKVIKNGN